MAGRHCPSAATHQMCDPARWPPGASWVLGSKSVCPGSRNKARERPWRNGRGQRCRTSNQCSHLRVHRGDRDRGGQQGLGWAASRVRAERPRLAVPGNQGFGEELREGGGRGGDEGI